jgi:hypothetical protein
MDLRVTRLWPEICQNINSKYHVLEAFNLLDVDRSMAHLEQQLSQYRSRAFQDNERLVFSLYDTEYYMPYNKLGFTSYNLISLLHSLDISFGYCQLWTNHHGITDVIHRLCNDYGSAYPVQVFENNYTFSQTISMAETVPRATEDITYHFAMLSNVPRSHRNMVRCYIQDRNLNEKTLMAWNPCPTPLVESNPDLLQNKLSNNINSSQGYLTVAPFTRIRDYSVNNTELSELYHRNAQCLEELYRNPLIPELSSTDQLHYENLTFMIPNHFDANFLQYSFLNIVGETVFDYPYPYITEKTFKCFWHRSPFIIVGAPGSLAYVKQLGFKTFDPWWNESYDLIQNPAERLTAIFKLLDIISNWSLDRCQEVYNEMSDVLNHNQQHYNNYYCKELLEQTMRQI